MKLDAARLDEKSRLDLEFILTRAQYVRICTITIDSRSFTTFNDVSVEAYEGGRAAICGMRILYGLHRLANVYQ